MPQLYTKMRDSLIRRGKAVKTAKRMAAILYYKRTGQAVGRHSATNNKRK